MGSTDGGVDADAVIAAAGREVETGRWADAALRLFELADAAPELPAAHRKLARPATELATWHGSWVSSDDPSDPIPRFVPLTELAARHPDAVVLQDPVGVGRRAMERAIELKPRSIAWLAPLAELREADGDLAGAIDAYERAVAGSSTSHSAWVVKSRHLWQFQLERARFRLGQGRVEDPLFEATLDVDPVAPTGAPVGLYRARFTHQGLNVGGMVVLPDVDTVEVAFDGEVLRRVNVGAGAPLRPFDMLLRRSLLDVAPTDARLTVATPEGRLLWAHGRAEGVQVRLPRASGQLWELLARGVRVDKKGGLTPTAQEAAARQDDLLRLYGRVRAFFRDEFDRELFALYGTLLGIHRQGELIPGDDDLDCGYVASGTDPAAVKAEAVRFIEELVRTGFSVSINRRGRLLRVHHDAIGDASLHLDVHPVWFEGPDLYVHNHHRFPASVDDLLPAEERDLRGGTMLVPRRPEVLLERFYGPGWRTPDPGYVDDSSDTAPDVMERLSEALLTPDEHRALAERLDDPAAVRSGQGRLVSIAAQSLYPLKDLVE